MLKFCLLFALVFSASAFHEEFWTPITAAHDNDVHSVLLFVKPAEGAAASCNSLLMEISDPSSPKYEQFLHFDELQRFTDMRAYRQLMRFLRASGFTRDMVMPTPNKEIVRLIAPVHLLNKFLGTRLHVYSSVEDEELEVVRDLEYGRESFPAFLKELVADVSHVYTLPAPPSVHKMLFDEDARRRQTGNVSPSLLHSFYGISQNKVHNAEATGAVFESLGQSFSPSDLASFQRTYNLPNNPVAKVIGQNNPNQPGGEANLDVQWFNAIANNVSLTYWSIPGNGDIFLTWIEAVSADAHAPLVHSVSYGSIAPEDPKVDQITFDLQVCKVGLRGITVVVATGDDGVANFIARNNPSACGFSPSFPATSAYTVSVGATQGPEAGNPEITCSSATGGLITSGGGFSGVIKRPDYQDKDVLAYLANGPNMPPRSKFSSQGRAYPDVAMMGHNYPITINGQTEIGSGTSASTPVFAGVLTLINGDRLNKGKKPLGFITSRLYNSAAHTAGIYNDITSGRNNCCAGQQGSQVCCEYGFTATTGWDATTGFGSINFPKFANYFGITL